jgi:FixJ family two-component response regulator
MTKRKPMVFLVSGYSEISLEEARKLGARDLLNKPVDYDKLCQAIISSARTNQPHSSSGSV